MGEHPPLLTPQGPGVSRARRPGFPRVDDSDTSRVSLSFPDSWWIAPPFAASASSPASRRFFSRPDTGSSTGLPALVAFVFPSASFPFFPFPCVQFSPVPPISSLLHLHVHRRSGSIPDLLSDFGSTAPASGLGYCGPRIAPKRPRTTPPERQGPQGRDRHINISRALPQYNGN